MKLADIIQMQKDRSNGVVLSQISIGKLIVHALMREVEAEQRALDNQTLRNDNHYLKQQLNEAKAMTTIKTLDQRIEDAAGATVTVAEQLEMSRAEVAELKQALADKDLALMEQTEIAQKAVRYVSDLYYRQRQDGNEIARLTEIAQAAKLYADNGQQHEDPTGPNHPGHHDGHTCEAMGQMLADFGSQRTTPEAVVAGMDAQAALSVEQILAIAAPFVSDAHGFFRKPELFEVIGFAHAILATRQPAPVDPVVECAKCDGQGATHYPDGEWEGKCAACKGTGIQPAPACQHRIADARNSIVKSGYLCVDCGAVFSAADHDGAPVPARQQWRWMSAQRLRPTP